LDWLEIIGNYFIISSSLYLEEYQSKSQHQITSWKFQVNKISCVCKMQSIFIENFSMPIKISFYQPFKKQIKFHYNFHLLHDSLLLFHQKTWFIFEAMPRELHSFIFSMLLVCLLLLYNKQRSHCNASMRTSSAQLSVSEWKYKIKFNFIRIFICMIHLFIVKWYVQCICIWRRWEVKGCRMTRLRFEESVLVLDMSLCHMDNI